MAVEVSSGTLGRILREGHFDTAFACAYPDGVRDLLNTGLTLLVCGVLVLATNFLSSTPSELWTTVGGTFAGVGVILLLVAFWISPTRISASQWLWRLVPAQPSQGNLKAVMTPADQKGIARASFTTNAAGTHDVTTTSGQLPTRLHFIKPRKMTIRNSDLPAEVPGKRNNMRVTHFVPGGFMVNERDCVGDVVEVEIYFD